MIKCPKCQGAMHPVTVDDITVDCCGSCQGIWFDLREHEHLKSIKGSEKQIDTGTAEQGKKLNQVRDIHCPRCTVKLVKLTVPDQPHIQFEQCATCGGAFFDAGEFTDYKSLTIAERIKEFLFQFRH